MPSSHQRYTVLREMRKNLATCMRRRCPRRA
jgi:hypothetical protein